MENQNLNTQQALPNSTGVLVLGILSIVFCFCYGIVGTILGVIGIVMASKANKIYQASPDSYTESSYKNMKAGRVCAIIGTCISGIYLLIMLVYIAFFGALLTSMPWEQMLNQ